MRARTSRIPLAAMAYPMVISIVIIVETERSMLCGELMD
jgi:hypothetical protein